MSAAQEDSNHWTAPASDLVRRIMNRSGNPGFVTLAVENRSSLSPSDVATAKRAIEDQFRSENVKLVRPERAVADITITVSEDPRGLLWVAEIKQGPTSQTVMLQSAKVTSTASSVIPTLTLRRKLVYVAPDDNPMLDFVLTDAKTLFVLRDHSITGSKWDGSRWTVFDTLNIEASIPTPRDARGRLIWETSQLVAYLPGVQCTAPLGSDGSPKGIECNNVDDPWPLDDSYVAFFTSSRNFFSGIVRGANFNSAVKSIDVSLPPFYSASAIGESGAVWVYAGTDGRARLYTSFAQPPRVYSGWGSDMASVRSGCGSQWQLLISKPGDRFQADAVQAMEIVNGEPVPVSAPLALPGAITSMWRGSDGASANVISRDPATDKYEASILSIDCR